MMSSGLTTHQPMRVICVKVVKLTWFCSETIIMISHKCIKCKTRKNLNIKNSYTLLKILMCFKNISMLSVGTFSNKYLRSFVP